MFAETFHRVYTADMFAETFISYRKDESSDRIPGGPGYAAVRRTAMCCIGCMVLAGCSGLFGGKMKTAEAWVTSADGSSLLRSTGKLQKVDGTLRKSGSLPAVNASLNPREKFQTIDGFGASMTESSAWCIASLPQEERDALMRRLFDPVEGLGLSFLRQPMGSPDFALSTYSYDDIPSGQTDFALERFTIDRDRVWILPLLKQAKEINPALKIMASPWSPPAWMKTGGTMLGASGGRLREDCYQAYADYFTAFIRAYEAEGLPVYAVTSQNEVNYAPPLYAGMLMSPREEAVFVGRYLGPTLEKAGLDAKIFCYDHNWDHPEMAAAVLSDPEASKWLAGSAWHHYAGEPGIMSRIKEQFPSKDVWFTEGGSGRWIGKGTFSGNFREGMSMAVSIMQNQARSLVLWNIALDGNNGPIVFPNTANYGLVRIDVDSATGKGSLSQTERASLYVLSHFSKFISPGSRRIGMTIDGSDLPGVAFRNPDGSSAAVFWNPYFSDLSIRAGIGADQWIVPIPSHSAVTVVFDR